MSSVFSSSNGSTSISVATCAHFFGENRDNVFKLLENANKHYPSIVFVWNEIDTLVRHINNQVRSKSIVEKNDICPLTLSDHPLTVNHFKAAIVDYIRNHIDPLISPYYDIILAFRIDKATQAASCLISLCSDPWFIEMIKDSQQILPLAHVVTINGPRSQGILTVCPLRFVKQMPLWWW
jgi:hypothetical protein